MRTTLPGVLDGMPGFGWFRPTKPTATPVIVIGSASGGMPLEASGLRRTVDSQGRSAGRTAYRGPWPHSGLSCRTTTRTLLLRTARSPWTMGGEWLLRHYELMVILDPTLEERTVAPSLDTFLGVVTRDGGAVEKVDIWGRRRLAYEIDKHADGIYAVIDMQAEPATVTELDRQLNLNDAVLRTKIVRPDTK